MAEVAGSTRDRMIEAAVTSLQKSGLAGMSFTEVLISSGAARGAIYHHFPGGKKQLVAEAAARNGERVRAHLTTVGPGTPRDVVHAFLDLVRPVAQAASNGSGCAVAAVTVGTDTRGTHAGEGEHADGGEDELCGIAASAFASWTGELARALTDAGLPGDHAIDLAGLLIALLEGTQILCRATGDLEPFDRAARAALALAEPTADHGAARRR